MRATNNRALGAGDAVLLGGADESQHRLGRDLAYQMTRCVCVFVCVCMNTQTHQRTKTQHAKYARPSHTKGGVCVVVSPLWCGAVSGRGWLVELCLLSSSMLLC